MRLPLAVNYGPRDTARTKDEVSINAFSEQGASGQMFAVKRPGTKILGFYPPLPAGGYDIDVVSTGIAQGVYQNGKDIYFVVNSTLHYCLATNQGSGSVGEAAHAELDGDAEDHFYFVQMPDTNHVRSFFLKSTKYAYRVYDMSVTQISDVDYPATTVPGAVYLDGTYYVMTPTGYIYGSELEDPLTWSGLNVIRAGSMPDAGVAIRRMINYVVAFGQYTTEFFYDAANPYGSPLAPVTNAIALIGCASADSIAETENTLYFMGVMKEHGRAVYRFNGTVPERVSTPFIDRIISGDDLAEVWAYFIRINGHPMYVLTLKTSAVTLVFDTITNIWHEWTSEIPGEWAETLAGD